VNKKHLWIAAAAVIGVLIVAIKNRYPRGLRNHNPGNVRHIDGQDWQGQVGDDGGFVVFESPEWGVRAIARVLNSYYYRHGLRNIGAMIARYSPPTENDTAAYIKAVTDFAGVGADVLLQADQFESIKPKIVEAIIQHENGQQPYTVAQINEWVTLA